MNFLPIILIVVFLINKKGGEFLSGFDFESISPLLSLFGVSDEILTMLKSDGIKDLANGNFDLKTIVPIVTSMFSKMKNEPPSPQENSFSTNQTPEYLNPIKDVANADIISSLGTYFK